jgi:hypothetical protein
MAQILREIQRLTRSLVDRRGFPHALKHYREIAFGQFLSSKKPWTC